MPHVPEVLEAPARIPAAPSRAELAEARLRSLAQRLLTEYPGLPPGFVRDCGGITGRVAAAPTTAVPPSQVPSLRNELSALYPELAADVIVSALEGAHLAAMSLAGREPVPDARLRTLACDRLDLALARGAARQRWETNQGRDHGRPGEHGPGTVACTYCRASIPAEKFSFWSDAKRLRSAGCPCCRRRVTILAATWRRQTERRQAEPRRLAAPAGGPDAASP